MNSTEVARQPGGRLSRAWRRRQQPARARVAALALVGAVAVAGSTVAVLAQPAAAAGRKAAATGAFLQAVNLKGYGEVLASSSHMSLYGLSSESAQKLVCKGACLTYWPPLEVSSGTKSVSLGAGVSGVVGFVARSATKKQVTFDGVPLYMFIKDTKPGQTFGEGVAAFGGTWGLVHASALILPAKSGGSGSTSSTTVTTTKYGY
jgi:predicted lipoprotein with Yx(FWY)xxD motif